MNERIRTSLTAAGNSITLDPDTGRVRVLNEALLRSHGIDSLVYLAVFGTPDRQAVAQLGGEEYKYVKQQSARSCHCSRCQDGGRESPAGRVGVGVEASTGAAVTASAALAGGAAYTAAPGSNISAAVIFAWVALRSRR